MWLAKRRIIELAHLFTCVVGLFRKDYAFSREFFNLTCRETVVNFMHHSRIAPKKTENICILLSKSSTQYFRLNDWKKLWNTRAHTQISISFQPWNSILLPWRVKCENTKTFRDIRTFKILYCALIRSHMEFGVLVWNPVQKKHSDAMEKIQRRFLRYVYLRTFEYYPTTLVTLNYLKAFSWIP